MEGVPDSATRQILFQKLGVTDMATAIVVLMLREKSLLMYHTHLLLFRLTNTNIKSDLSIYPTSCPSILPSTHPSV